MATVRESLKFFTVVVLTLSFNAANFWMKQNEPTPEEFIERQKKYFLKLHGYFEKPDDN